MQLELDAQEIPSHLQKYFEPVPGLKPKDLCMIPARVAMALQADGWILRSEIIWHKRAPMPESVTDRPTKAHEQLFLLSKSPHYFYDHTAIMEQSADDSGWAKQRANGVNTWDYGREGYNAHRIGGMSGKETSGHPNIRNKRSVWTLGPEQFAGSHFATMPTKLVEPCILAGTSSYGACAKCGAPWARVVERERTTYDGRKATTPHNPNGAAHSNYGDMQRNIAIATTTLGWAATCTCNADVVPCTVLDPFSGASTTGYVALKHGRKYIGLELNESYIAMSHKRLLGVASQQRLFEVT